MSTQSILVKNIENYQDIFNDEMLNIGKSYSLYRRFNIGSSIDFNKMNYTRMLNKIVCTDNSELKNYIQKKITGSLEECGIKVKDKRVGHLKKYCDESKGACEFNKCEIAIMW